MTREEFTIRTKDLVNSYHLALAYSMGGLTWDLVEPLIEQGLITVEDLSQIMIGGFHPYLFLRVAAQAWDAMDEITKARARDWTIEQWTPVVQDTVEEFAREGIQIGGGITVEFDRPTPSVETLHAPSDAPEWLAPSEVEAYHAARTRAGSYARGLGNIVAADVEKSEAEEWEGEEITVEVRPEVRARTVEIIRERTAEAVVNREDANKLASRLGNDTGRWAHDWKRIAETELQGVHNEGRVRDAIEFYGEQTRISRITESGACPHCIRLFRDGDGNPRIFPVQELIANGTNVGRKKADWRPTIWPVHPKCRCDTIAVPPGMVVLSDGRIRREANV